MTYGVVSNPYEPIVGLTGIGLNGGALYIGVDGSDPEAFPQQCYWDAAGAVPAFQPISIIGGYPMYLGSPARLYTGPTYSIRVRDRSGVQVFYEAHAVVVPNAFQGMFATIAAAQATVIASTVQASGLQILGYYSAGDGGGADYRYATVQAAGAGKFRSLDGAWWQIVGTELTPRQFGAYGTGLVDDTAAVSSWFSYLGSGVLGKGGGGVYNVASATLGSAGCALNANTQAELAGAKFVVTGTSSCNLLMATDVSGIRIEGGWFVGNNQASGSGVGYAMQILLTAGAAADISGFQIRKNRFDNFKGDYWINVGQLNATHAIRDGWIDENRFYSFSGNSRNAGDIGVPSQNISLNGNQAGGLFNWWVTNNYSDAKWIKTFCAVWSYATNVRIHGNVVDNPGVGAGAGGAGAYGFLCYSSVSQVNRVSICNNVVNSPYACGLYTTGAEYLTISGNTITGQADTVEVSLPKAAIAVDSSYNVVIADNNLFLNFTDISVQGPEAGGEANISIAGNQMVGGASGRGIRLIPIPGANWSGVTITGNNVKRGAKGIEFSATDALAITDVVISGNRIEAPYGVDVNGQGVANCKAADILITGNRIKSTTYGVYAANVDDVSIIGNDFNGNAAGGQVMAQNATNFTASGNRHKGQSTAQVYTTPSATGTIWGNSFLDCATLVTAGGLGYTAPVFSGGYGQLVQNLAPGVSGGAGTTYNILGWQCMGGTTWVEMRVPDQNNVATA